MNKRKIPAIIMFIILGISIILTLATIILSYLNVIEITRNVLYICISSVIVISLLSIAVNKRTKEQIEYDKYLLENKESEIDEECEETKNDEIKADI
ncbi:MAG: hypothetical protein RSE07_01210 [Oscillospiraceae bacterium]